MQPRVCLTLPEKVQCVCWPRYFAVTMKEKWHFTLLSTHLTLHRTSRKRWQFAGGCRIAMMSQTVIPCNLFPRFRRHSIVNTINADRRDRLTPRCDVLITHTVRRGRLARYCDTATAYPAAQFRAKNGIICSSTWYAALSYVIRPRSERLPWRARNGSGRMGLSTLAPTILNTLSDETWSTLLETGCTRNHE